MSRIAAFVAFSVALLFGALVAQPPARSDEWPTSTRPAPAAAARPMSPAPDPTPVPAATPAPTPAAVGWQLPITTDRTIQGYASTTSVSAGQSFTLFVSTAAREYVVRAFRMGWYGGALGRQVWLSRALPGRHQPGPREVAPATRTWDAPWQPSVTISTRGWQPGDYLLRLETGDGHASYVPITVRARSAQGRVVLVNEVTTWQAYNLWGGSDLYEGANGSFATRSRAVSFDRPYAKEDGAGQFIHDELGVVAEAERLGLTLDYVTDLDLAARPHLLDGAAAVISMGHDEYYSPSMRAALTQARAQGANIAFLGANGIYRRIRLGSTAVGPSRLEINYKIAREDPLYGVDNAQVTADWPSPPDAQPESSLLGDQYGCYFGDVPDIPGVVSNPSTWFFAGTHAYTGELLPWLIGPEIDSVMPGYPAPPGSPVQIVMRSPAICAGVYPAYAEASYYVAPSGAGVFDAGTNAWSCEVAPRCAGRRTPLTHAVVRQVTDNILRAFALPRAGESHPAT